MGAPRLGLRGTVGQTDVVERRGMGSKTCMSPMVGHKQRTDARSQRNATHKCTQAA